MLGLFHHRAENSSSDLSQEIKDMVPTFLDRAFPCLTGAQQLTPEFEKQIKEQLQQAFLDVLKNTQRTISIDAIKQKLLNHELDESVLNTPRRSQEIDLLIQNDNHFFMQHLIMFCQSEHTLNFWLTYGGATMPQGALAEAIRLRADICVFQRLEKDGALNQITQADKEQVSKQAARYLREKPASLEFLNAALDKHVQTLAP